MPKIISKRKFNILRKTKEEIFSQIVYTKKRNGLHKAAKEYYFKDKDFTIIEDQQDRPDKPEELDTPDIPKPPKPPKGPDQPEEPGQPGGPDDPNSGNKKMPKPDEFVTHRQLQEFKKDLLVELHEIFPTKPELKRVEEKVDVLFELQKAQGDQIRIQGEQIKELKVEQKAQGETLQLILQTLQKMNDRLDKIEGKMDKMESRMDKMETRLDKLESK